MVIAFLSGSGFGVGSVRESDPDPGFSRGLDPQISDTGIIFGGSGIFQNRLNHWENKDEFRFRKGPVSHLLILRSVF